MIDDLKMSNQDGLGNFATNEDKIYGITFVIFNAPERNGSVIYGKEFEIRSFAVLER